MITKKINGYFVVSDTTKKDLGGPYETRAKAIKSGLRLPNTYGHVSLLKLAKKDLLSPARRAPRKIARRSK
ncbi:MAG: hypothetical protein Q7S10_00845 [bacterium]|nr:hypothetical protein [bacterium]